MTGIDPTRTAADNYRDFAGHEAAGRSPDYERLALFVADDEMVLAFVTSLPAAKQQPNLLFAAARYLLDGVPPDPDSLQRLIADRPTDLWEVIRSRRTQTNEPARCATLLPALAALPQPLALIEVGASAGLTLLVDRYNYDYAGHRVEGLDPEGPLLSCAPRGPVPLPDSVPEVIWRAGLDLNPLDVGNDDDMFWLRCLLWPGEGDREERLALAVTVARADPPRVLRGDLRDDLPALMAEAPVGATLVVFHTAVLAYVGIDDRRRFAESMRESDALWLSNEGVRVLPDVDVPAHSGSPFVLVRDGVQPLAFTDPHGTWVQWLPDPRAVA